MRSSEEGLLYAFWPFLSRVHLSVDRLMVSIVSWFRYLLIRPLMLLFLPTPFSIRMSSILAKWCSRTRAVTVGPSKVILSSTRAEPASLSALSFRCTTACPGQNIHWMRLIWLLFRETHQYACSLPHLIFSRVLIESVRNVTYWSASHPFHGRRNDFDFNEHAVSRVA